MFKWLMDILFRSETYNEEKKIEFELEKILFILNNINDDNKNRLFKVHNTLNSLIAEKTVLLKKVDRNLLDVLHFIKSSLLTNEYEEQVQAAIIILKDIMDITLYDTFDLSEYNSEEELSMSESSETSIQDDQEQNFVEEFQNDLHAFLSNHLKLQ
jgi:hypothetical protein